MKLKEGAIKMVRYKRLMGKDFETIQQRMERMLGTIFDEMRPTMFSVEKVWRPPVDIYETPEEVVVLVEIAGMSKRDINVTMEEDVLRISGTRPDYSPSTKMKLHQMEIDYGRFERTIKISLPIDIKRITAHYKEGFLQITLTKKKLPHAVTVEASHKE
jgi:HSP20 family protein